MHFGFLSFFVVVLKLFELFNAGLTLETTVTKTILGNSVQRHVVLVYFGLVEGHFPSQHENLIAEASSPRIQKW